MERLVSLVAKPRYVHSYASSPRLALRSFQAAPGHRLVCPCRTVTSSSLNRARFDDGSRSLNEDQSPFKQQRLRQLGEDRSSVQPIYPEAYPRLELKSERISVPEFLEAFHNGQATEEVSLAGRVRSKRVLGKSLIFLDLENEFQRVQVMLSKKKLNISHRKKDAWSLFRNLIQVGDHVAVTGSATTSETGEPTLAANDIPELLSPTMEQIPEKLTDPKTRMQARHVDMLVNRQTVDILRLRSEITRCMRDHLHSKRFLEFQTPILAENAGGAVARPFLTRATEFRNKDLAMRVAPELWLKRLVVGGVDRVFEIGPAFRNEGIDATHNPEYTTCEFYSAYSNLNDLINETEQILFGLAEHSQKLISTQLTTLPPIDLSRYTRPFKQVEFIPGLEQALGFRFPKLSAEDAFPELLAVLKLHGIQIPGDKPESLPKLLDRLAASYIEPMSFEEPIFIINHPVCMSPLAKSFLCPKTYQLLSARAELFVGGREVANMYEEENDPEEQQRKLIYHRKLMNMPDGSIGLNEAEDATKAASPEEGEMSAARESEEEEAAPLDQSFIKALDYGLPPTGGWGCGVDRLVMLFSGANRIGDCLSFGTLQNVVGLTADEEKRTKPPKSQA